MNRTKKRGSQQRSFKISHKQLVLVTAPVSTGASLLYQCMVNLLLTVFYFTLQDGVLHLNFSK